MLKVTISTIGKCKELWLSDALSEYERRMKSRVQIEWRLAKDDAQLIGWLEFEPHLIGLDPKGELVTSEELCKKLGVQRTTKLHFVIGGAVGLPSPLKGKFTWLWSLSPLTFTHQMTRLILLEQLYRCWEMERGSQYHK